MLITQHSNNYVDGDMYFEYEFTEPVLLPFTLEGSMSDYQAKADYSPHIDIGLVISDPEMYNVLKQVPETDMKVADAVQKMENCLMQFTTLKKFLMSFLVVWPSFQRNTNKNLLRKHNLRNQLRSNLQLLYLMTSKMRWQRLCLRTHY